MRHHAVVLVLAFIVLVLLGPRVGGTLSQCCEYTFIISDTQPKPGERVDITGAITDQLGGGEPSVVIQYEDSLQRNGSSLVNATTNPNGGFQFSVNIPIIVNSPNTVFFTISFNDSLSGWKEVISDNFPSPASAPSGDFPTLYASSLGNGGRANAYFSYPSAGSPAIIYISGGYDQPILHGVASLDQATQAFLGGLVSDGFNVISPIGWNVQNLPVFPFTLAAMLRYGFHINQIYLVGWSAGGTVASWSLTHDSNHLFNLGVLMDAEVNGAGSQTQTNPSVFKAVDSASSVLVPHLLIWGINEAGSTGIQNAMLWTERAGSGLVRLDPFPYSHQWIGTDVEIEITADILAFFKAQSVGTTSRFQSGNITIQILTDSLLNISNYSYNPQGKVFAFSIKGQNESVGSPGSLNVAIPVSSIDGQPVVLLDNSSTPVAYSSDGSVYHIFLSYVQSKHAVIIGGQNSVPEFTNGIDARSLLFSLSIILVVSAIKRRTAKGRRD